MNIRKFNEEYGRLVLIVISILIWGWIISSFFTKGYFQTWLLWGFPVKPIVFMDFQLIPSAAETFRSGMDPAISNPNDPVGHIFNYPKIWYLVFYTGISQKDTIWICALLILLFFLTIFIFPGKLQVFDAFAMLAIIFSSSCILLYERGNVDLVFFILCGLAVVLVSNYPAWTVTILSLAAMFKLFPFFGVIIFLQDNKSKFFKLLIVSVFIFVIYIVLSFDSLAAAWKLTQRGTYLSYGFYIVFDILHAYFRYYLLKIMTENQIVDFMKILPYVVATLILLLFSYLGISAKIPFKSDSERNLTAFRMGGAIYIGTFLLGNNWNYRLAFLIFAVPQISQWMFSRNKKQKYVALITFIALLISCWYTVIFNYFLIYSEGENSLQYEIFDEIVNWILFAGLIYLFFVSAPSWVRNFFGFLSLQEPKEELLSFKFVDSDYANRLTEITISAKRHWNYPEEWIQEWIPAMTISEEYILANEVWMVVEEDKPIAYYSLAQNEEGLWLDNLWVLPEYIGQGIGKALFDHALERCKAREISVIKIEADPNAQGFYEKMGAEKVSEHHAQIFGIDRVLPIMEIKL